ncbi:hypothetical protein Aperf_G00000075614 [Anoplocephala perfoliata]
MDYEAVIEKTNGRGLFYIILTVFSSSLTAIGCRNSLLSGMPTLPMDYETAIERVYGRGIFCIILAVLLSYLTATMSFEFQSIVFLGFSPQFNCSDDRILNASYYSWIPKNIYDKLKSGQGVDYITNENSPIEQCYAIINNGSESNHALACEKFTYDASMMRHSLTTEFDLVCDRKSYVNWLTSATIIASALGNLIAVFTDRFRRRRVILLYMAMDIFWSLITPLSSNFLIIFICRIMRMLSTSVPFLAINMLHEILPANKRSIYGNLYWIPFSLGYIGTAGLAYLTRDWRLFRYYGLIALTVYIPLFVILPESPRWLLLNRKYSEYHTTLTRLAKWNGANLPDEFLNGLNEPSIDKSVGKTETIMEILKSPNVRRVLAVFCYCLAASCCGYFSFSTRADSASDNVFLSVFVLGLGEVPAGLTGWVLCCLFNRRNSTIFASLLVATCFIIVPIIRPLSSLANTVIVGLGKLILAVQFNILLLHAAEFFPTSVRNMGLFLVMAFGNGVSGLVPFINELSAVHAYLPGIVYAIMNVSAAILIHLFLPNTKNCPLAQTINEAESLRRGQEANWIKAMRSELKLEDQ